MRDKLLLILLMVLAFSLGWCVCANIPTSSDNSENTQHLIASMEEAKRIHQEWAEGATDNATIAGLVGNRQWHLNWVVIYDDVIKELRG